MRNEERGIWKKAIFVLAIIIAIITFCQTVSAFIYCPIHVEFDMTPGPEVYLDDKISYSVKVTSEDPEYEQFKVLIAVYPNEGSDRYPMILVFWRETKAGKELKGTFSASSLYHYYGVSGDYIFQVAANVIDGPSFQSHHGKFHLYNYSRSSTPPTSTVMTTPTSTPISSPTLLPTPTPSPTPKIEKNPSEQIPPQTPAPPGNEGGEDGWLIFIISAIALVSIAVLFKPVMLKYYERKMRKWEKEGYDVSELKEVLKK